LQAEHATQLNTVEDDGGGSAMRRDNDFFDRECLLYIEEMVRAISSCAMPTHPP
jgi:hypothetical protein